MIVSNFEFDIQQAKQLLFPSPSFTFKDSPQPTSLASSNPKSSPPDT